MIILFLLAATIGTFLALREWGKFIASIERDEPDSFR